MTINEFVQIESRVLTTGAVLGVVLGVCVCVISNRVLYWQTFDIEVRNNSTQTVKRFMIVEAHSPAIEGGPLAPGEFRNYRIHLDQESGYHVEVEFEDGRMIKGPGTYAEAGYSFVSEIVESGTTSRWVDYAHAKAILRAMILSLLGALVIVPVIVVLKRRVAR